MPGRGGGRGDDGPSDLSAEDIAWRIGAADAEAPPDQAREARPEAVGDSASDHATGPRARSIPTRTDRPERVRVVGAPVRHAHRPTPLADRGVLWRDAAAFAAIFLAIALSLQLGVIGGPDASRSAGPTQLALGATATPVVSDGLGVNPSVPTIGPVVAPGLGLDPSGGPATSAPGPVTARSPAPTARATARPTARASSAATPQPSATPPSPSASGTAAASATPTPEPPTPPPPALAALSCDTPVGFDVVCHDLSTGIVAASEGWATSDGSATFSPRASGTATVTITFSGSGSFTVTVTVKGLDGTTPTSAPVTVAIP